MKSGSSARATFIRNDPEPVLIARNGRANSCVEVSFGNEVAEQKLRADVCGNGACLDCLAGLQNHAVGTLPFNQHALHRRVGPDDGTARNSRLSHRFRDGAHATLCMSPMSDLTVRTAGRSMICRPWRSSSRSAMTFGFSRLTVYEATEFEKPGANSSVLAAPPTTELFSSTMTDSPARARYEAVVSPLWPPPIIATSNFAWFTGLL